MDDPQVFLGYSGVLPSYRTGSHPATSTTLPRHSLPPSSCNTKSHLSGSREDTFIGRRQQQKKKRENQRNRSGGKDGRKNNETRPETASSIPPSSSSTFTHPVACVPRTMLPTINIMVGLLNASHHSCAYCTVLTSTPRLTTVAVSAIGDRPSRTNPNIIHHGAAKNMQRRKRGCKHPLEGDM